VTAEFIDNLLKRLGTHGGTGLRLEAGSAVRMVEASGGMRTVTTRLLTRDEIVGALTPIIPEETKRQLQGDSSAEFEYMCNGVGRCRVSIQRHGDHVIVAIDMPGAVTAPAARIEAPAAAIEAPVTAPTPEPRTATPVPEPAPIPQAVTSSPVNAAPVTPPPAVVSETPNPPVAAPAPVRPTASLGVHAIDRLFFLMSEAKASDLHLSVGMPPLIRKDGSMQPLEAGTAALEPEAIVSLLDPIMPSKNREEFARRHDTDFAYEIPALARFRANVFMDRKGRGAVFRVIPSKILTAEDLGLSPHILQLCKLNKGLVLVTGPTGSGKSTTLCAMIDYINRTRADHVITIEDPIEFVHENKRCLMNQREVHTHTDSFKDALRAALREDPDIVLVGEMRDLETVAIAIETAETGHLVFGTLHTTTAASTVDRIIDQFPTDRQAQIRIMLSESLKGVIAQTLCKKIGGGRAAALEVLIVTSAVSNLIREGKTFQIPSIMQVGKAVGMVSLNDALMELVTKKIVAPEEAYTKAVDKAAFETLLKRAGIDTRFAAAAEK
jgi:twitching motility protein PilT